MNRPATLVLSDGTSFAGQSIGAPLDVFGEVVFTTAMTGYQEMLTDPSFAGQIVVPTYPLMGNYGVNLEDIESDRIQVAGFVVRNSNDRPSHALSSKTLNGYLLEQGVPLLSGVDTRAIVKKLRTHGVMMGALVGDTSKKRALARLMEAPQYGSVNFVSQVSTKAIYRWEASGERSFAYSDEKTSTRIVVVDCGVKYNILRILSTSGFEVLVVPAETAADKILSLNPDGIVLSPGPGDPELLENVAESVKGLIGRVPIMGICLGHQIVARAFGGKTYKLKFGHRGGNHPVKDLISGSVCITAQNHGYAVDRVSLPSELEITHVNLNDGTIEGLRHRAMPLLTIQYHSEASPGPRDSEYLFDRFFNMLV